MEDYEDTFSVKSSRPRPMLEMLNTTPNNTFELQRFVYLERLRAGQNPSPPFFLRRERLRDDCSMEIIDLTLSDEEDPIAEQQADSSNSKQDDPISLETHSSGLGNVEENLEPNYAIASEDLTPQSEKQSIIRHSFQESKSTSAYNNSALNPTQELRGDGKMIPVTSPTIARLNDVFGDVEEDLVEHSFFQQEGDHALPDQLQQLCVERSDKSIQLDTTLSSCLTLHSQTDNMDEPHQGASQDSYFAKAPPAFLPVSTAKTSPNYRPNPPLPEGEETGGETIEKNKDVGTSTDQIELRQDSRVDQEMHSDNSHSEGSGMDLTGQTGIPSFPGIEMVVMLNWLNQLCGNYQLVNEIRNAETKSAAANWKRWQRNRAKSVNSKAKKGQMTKSRSKREYPPQFQATRENITTQKSNTEPCTVRSGWTDEQRRSIRDSYLHSVNRRKLYHPGSAKFDVIGTTENSSCSPIVKDLQPHMNEDQCVSGSSSTASSYDYGFELTERVQFEKMKNINSQITTGLQGQENADVTKQTNATNSRNENIDLTSRRYPFRVNVKRRDYSQDIEYSLCEICNIEYMDRCCPVHSSFFMKYWKPAL